AARYASLSVIPIPSVATLLGEHSCLCLSPLRHPPTPPLFPYTTLFRSQSCPGLLQQRLQRGVFLGERRDVHVPLQAHEHRRRHREQAPESLCRRQPASCGRRLPSGRTRRQSRPSNKAANCARDLRIPPSRARRQTNLLPSRRVCTSTSPVRSQTRTLILSARFDRNTNAAPLKGSKPNISCTAAARPSCPLRKSTGRVATYTRSCPPGAIIPQPGRRGS